MICKEATSQLDVSELLSVRVSHDVVVRLQLGRTRAAGSGECASRLGQRQLALHRLQVVGDDRPSKGLPSFWRLDPDLERDRDSRQHETQ